MRDDYRRRGIGRALLHAVEEHLRREAVEFLQVKTLSPARPDANYADAANDSGVKAICKANGIDLLGGPMLGSVTADGASEAGASQ